ncbi:lipoprotein [Pseudomonas sp. D5002]|uniref:lipoprotein n=1 Tax=Pseudomonas sp. D5002 TaxID=2738818 RepID=UPI0015A09F4A|nr:lipoprotein [Pseudomonas sp. D5002]NWB09051.1 lipoprotein [Pseudomonas sp. D5002]
MRILIAAVAVVMLAGCSTSGVQEGAPSFSAQSQKTPQQYARCLGPKWQEFNPSTSSIETESGYKISASTAFTGVVALAVVDKSSGGSLVKVFLPMDWTGTAGWKDAAKACI